MRISKSKFVAGVQCLKRLYWEVHAPEIVAQPDTSTEAIIEQGREVGLLARRLFPGGVEVASSSGGLDDALRTTRELVANRKVPAIFEGAFEHGGVLVRVDILQRRRDNRWRLLEVKSTADLKEYHLYDVGIQGRVVSRSGLDLASSSLMHVNRNYIFRGVSIDVRQFFRIKNLTRRIARLAPKLTSILRTELTVLAMPNTPEIAPGRQCTEPVTCEFFDRCNPPRPGDHVGYLPRIHVSALEGLREIGVDSIHDIPDDFPLNERQRRACTSVQTGEPWYSPELKKELESLRYPLYFMDFETVNPAIPRFAGMRPFDHIPFQWSVHVQRKPGAVPTQYEFLATDSSDPRREFISTLCGALGKRGSIVVYNEGFESQRLSDLASWVPKFARQIKRIQRRLWDLLPVIRNNVYHPAFAGSFSLKAVLPALVPEMTYQNMAVANGQDAGLAWESMIREPLDQNERKNIHRALLDYCGLDTLALLKLTEHFRLILTRRARMTMTRTQRARIAAPGSIGRMRSSPLLLL
jgi:predicted RecB family nuclease